MTRLVIFLILAIISSPAYSFREIPTTKTQIQLSYAPIVKQVSPAVVNIYTKRKIQVRSSSPFNDPIFEQLFGQNFGGMNGMSRERIVSSLGSGVIVSSDGILVTSHHVIDKAQDIVAVLADGNEYKAIVILEDKASDLAVLQLSKRKEPYPYLKIINSDLLEVGDLVLAVGNPFGVGQTVTSGIVSALARSAGGVSDYQFFIQTDAAINPGNSGGALVNMQGKLVGINTAIYSRSGGSIGIGFAIPSNMIQAVLRSVKVGERSLLKPWLGARYQDLTAESAEAQGLKTPRGVLIAGLFNNSPAQKAGLQIGDVIISANDQLVSNMKNLMFRVAIASIDKPLKLRIIRKNKQQIINVNLEYPPEIPASDERTLIGRHPLAGITVKNLSPRIALELSLSPDKTGVVVTNGRNSLNMIKGDILISINNISIKSTRQLEKILKNPTRNWRIDFKRNGRLMRIQVSF